MGRGRMEAFSDGVLAIIITIMVLKLEVPPAPTLEALAQVIPTLLAYVLSFVYVGIYWVNHHFMTATVERVSSRMLWKDLHWLFWMSLIPFATEWMGANPFAGTPALLYGGVLFMCALSYSVLQSEIVRTRTSDDLVDQDRRSSFKARDSVLVYAVALACAYFIPIAAYTIYILIALAWMVPEAVFDKKKRGGGEGRAS